MSASIPKVICGQLAIRVIGLAALAFFLALPNLSAQPTITTASPLPEATQAVSYSETLAASGGTTPLSWAVTVGSEPAGLSLSAGGVLSGTPTGTGTSTFTVEVTDANSDTDSKVFMLTVNGAVTITTASPLPEATQAVSYSETLAASGGTAPLSWAVTVGSEPAGLSLSAGGVLSGTPTGTGTSTFTVEVTDANSDTDSKVFMLTVNGAVTITTASPLPEATQGASYSETLAASGGTTPLTWAVTTGSLPAGLALSTGGVISGTPTATGISNFMAEVTDANSDTDSKVFMLTVNGAVTITTASPLPEATQAVSYSETLAASGGTTPLTWAVTVGSEPAGLSLSAGGVLSGTPTGTGTSTFTVEVTDANSDTDSKVFMLTVNGAVTITTASPLPEATQAVSYSETLAASGGTTPLTWAVTVGSEPAGLSLSAGGVLSGTPTGTGTSTFTVEVTDANSDTDSKVFMLTVNGAVTITTASPLPEATQAVSYSETLAASGGTTPLTWAVTVGSEPAGLSLSAGGVLSGTPTGTGTSTFTVEVTDANSDTDSKVFMLRVNGAVTITTASPLPEATQGASYSETLAASGGTTPLTWAVTTGSLPAGLALSTGGVISGTPTATGISNFMAEVTDANSDTDSKVFMLRVNDAVTITTASPLPEATQGAIYPAVTLMASGGTGALTWAVTTGSLPAGLTLSMSTGEISGTPTGTGISNFMVEVTDSNAGSDSKTLVLNVNAGVDLAIAKSGPVQAAAGTDLTYSFAVANNGPANTNGSTVTVVDVLPMNVSFSDFTGASWTCSGDSMNPETVSCTTTQILTSGSGMATALSIDALVDASVSGVVTNSATVVGGGDATQSTSNPVSTLITESADLSIIKTGSGTVTAGNELMYTIQVANGGPSDATNVVVTDVLPSGVSFGSTEPLTAGCVETTAAVPTCTIGSLSDGDSVSYTITVSVDLATIGTITNTAVISGAGTDSDPSNNVSSKQTTVSTSAQSADLSLTKTDTGFDPVTADDPLEYGLTVTNVSTSAGDTASGIVVTDSLPSGLNAVTTGPVSPAPVGCMEDGTPQSGVLTCTFPASVEPLAMSASHSFKILATVDSAIGGSLLNTASVTATESDPNFANNLGLQTTRVNALGADLLITKSDTGFDPVDAGALITYKITVANGTDGLDATNVVVTDTLPSEVDFGDPMASTTCNNTLVPPGALGGTAAVPTCSFAGIDAGKSVSFDITGRVRGAGTGVMTNIASVTADQPDPDPGNNTTLEVTTVTPTLTPSVSGLNPPDIQAGEDTFQLVIEGNNLPPNPIVRWVNPNGIPAIDTELGDVSSSQAQIVVLVPEGLIDLDLGLVTK